MEKQAFLKTLSDILTEAAAADSMTLARAKQLLERGEEKARELGVPMVLTAVDDAGLVKAQHRMDGSLLASIEISYQKAFTAAALKQSTKEAAEDVLPGRPLYGLQYTHPGKFCLFGGGIPVISGSRLVGAVGVSGGTVEQDSEVAEYMLSANAEKEKA